MNGVLFSDHVEVLNTVSGTASASFILTHGILTKLVVTPATESTVYDIVIVERNSVDFFVERDIRGTYNETDMGEPIYSNITITIENASADEQFQILFAVRNS